MREIHNLINHIFDRRFYIPNLTHAMVTSSMKNRRTYNNIIADCEDLAHLYFVNMVAYITLHSSSMLCSKDHSTVSSFNH